MILTKDQYKELMVFIITDVVIYKIKTFNLIIFEKNNKLDYIHINYFGYRDYPCSNSLNYCRKFTKFHNIYETGQGNDYFYFSYTSRDEECSYLNKEEFGGLVDIEIYIDKKFLIFENYKDLTITYNENNNKKRKSKE